MGSSFSVDSRTSYPFDPCFSVRPVRRVVIVRCTGMTAGGGGGGGGAGSTRVWQHWHGKQLKKVWQHGGLAQLAHLGVLHVLQLPEQPVQLEQLGPCGEQQAPGPVHEGQRRDGTPHLHLAQSGWHALHLAP
jgi:hypothetical protein